MTELKPCPFCGGEAHTTETARYGNRWGARCGSYAHCGAFLGFYINEAEAIEAWNTRTGGHCAFAYPTDLTDGCALIPEQTCKQKRLFNLIRRECDGEWYEWHGEEMPNYCPNCGRKVVSADD